MCVSVCVTELMTEMNLRPCLDRRVRESSSEAKWIVFAFSGGTTDSR